MQTAVTIPKLDATGANWAIFGFQFQDAVEAKGYWSHFDETVSRLIFTDPAAPTTAETTAIAQWNKDKQLAKSLLTQKLLDSMVVLIHGKVLVKERWEVVVKEFSKKSKKICLHTDRSLCQVYGDALSRQDESERVLRKPKGTKGRTQSGRHNNQRKRLLLCYLILSSVLSFQFCI